MLIVIHSVNSAALTDTGHIRMVFAVVKYVKIHFHPCHNLYIFNYYQIFCTNVITPYLVCSLHWVYHS